MKIGLINMALKIEVLSHYLFDDKINVGDKLATLYVKDKNLKLNPDDYFEIK